MSITEASQLFLFLTCEHNGSQTVIPVVVLTFCGFPWVETSTAGRVYDLCVYYMTGAPEGSPKVVLCGFMVFIEKPGIEPATPGLQGIALIHYTTGCRFGVLLSVHLLGK